jgi:succinoglycan biosynthesis transport protein ExoP
VNEQSSTPSRAFATVRAIRRRLPIVLACLVVVPSAAVAISLLQDKEYTATATVLFRQPKLDEVVAGGAVFADLVDDNRFAVTNLRLISLDVVAERTAKRLGSPLDGDEVSESVDTSPKGQSDLATVSATGPSPGAAARLANTYATVYISMREEADHALIRQNVRVLQRQLDALPEDQSTAEKGAVLRDRLEKLQLLDQVKLGGIQLVQPAREPSGPSAPKPVRNALIGLPLGALLGIGLALMLGRLDRRLRDPEEVAAAFDSPLLTRIPTIDALPPASSNGTPLAGRDAEPFQTLRTKLRYSTPGGTVSSVLIASAVRREGRTTIAWNLAESSAGLGLNVLLVEADFHHPSLGHALDISGERGLGQVLEGEATLEESVRPLPAARGRGAEAGRVDLLVAGTASKSAIDLIDSSRMRDLVARSERQYDLVVVDSPASSESLDAVPLAKMVGAVIVVSRLGAVTRQAAAGLSEQLGDMGVEPLGIVLNSVDGADGRHPPDGSPKELATD